MEGGWPRDRAVHLPGGGRGPAAWAWKVEAAFFFLARVKFRATPWLVGQGLEESVAACHVLHSGDRHTNNPNPSFLLCWCF